jgi:predicted RNA-binding Zn-ribbon protein involved in translation (DUF1610 family)
MVAPCKWAMMPKSEAQGTVFALAVHCTCGSPRLKLVSKKDFVFECKECGTKFVVAFLPCRRQGGDSK